MADEKIPYDELVKLVADQAAELARLRTRVGELEKELQEARRQAAPFRRRASKKKPQAEKKQPGRAPGHPPQFRQPPAVVDHEITVPLSGCPHCQGELSGVTACEQIIEDLPPIRPVVFKVTTWRGHCSQCGDVRSTHPLQTSTATGAAGTHLGPRAQALAISLSHRSGLSMRRTCEALKVLCGLSLSPGGLAQLLQRTAGHLNDQYEQIKQTIRQSEAVFADETSWYVNEPGWWLWIFTSPTTTLYRVEKSRGSGIVLDTLGDQFRGTLVSDCLSTYDPIQCRKHKCIAHHLRALGERKEELAKRGIESNYLMLWKVLLQDVIATWTQRPQLAQDAFALKVLQIQRGVDNLLSRSPQQAEEIKFRNRLEKQKDHLLGCLAQPAAEPTNNRAERDLRPAVIDRKLSCGNKTQAGKEAWEVLRSITVTTVKRGQDLVDSLAQGIRLTARTNAQPR